MGKLQVRECAWSPEGQNSMVLLHCINRKEHEGMGEEWCWLPALELDALYLKIQAGMQVCLLLNLPFVNSRCGNHPAHYTRRHFKISKWSQRFPCLGGLTVGSNWLTMYWWPLTVKASIILWFPVNHSFPFLLPWSQGIGKPYRTPQFGSNDLCNSSSYNWFQRTHALYFFHFYVMRQIERRMDIWDREWEKITNCFPG